MLHSPLFRLAVLTLGLSLVVSGGCATTKPSRFYTLSPVATSGTQTEGETAGPSLAIGVGPIKLPEHLDRPQIVTRTSSNQLELAEFDRWAGSLKDDFSRVLSENLSILLATDRVTVYPWRKSVPIEYQVAVDVARFDAELGGNAWLIARWTVFGGRDKKVLFMERARISEPSSDQGYEAMVAAQSRALAQLSREIADAIKNISRKPANQ
ncbi:MAG: membrane integrity-associated transporter subunit PqiC [Deltaproteobacteria bacterium]|nr:membrane integrity-associated transporter subunit PqiC [Deltaproteobacteria bacterium]